MPSHRILTGLPELPNALPDKESNMLRPLYLATNTLAKLVSESTGQVDFDQSEMSQRDQMASILTQNHTRVFVQAGADLSYGKIVNLYLSGGKLTAQYADATDATKPAHGIVNETAGIPVGTFGEVLLFTGYTLGIGGTSVGSMYYLATNGDVALARPAVAGSIVQACGIGLGSAGFYLNISSLFIQN